MGMEHGLRPQGVKPIKPGDVEKQVDKSLPPEVIEVFNQLIVENYRNGRASFKFKEAANRIADKLEIPVQTVYDKGLLNVEEVYRKAGWRVKEDKPAYNEDYEGYWEFVKATRGTE